MIQTLENAKLWLKKAVEKWVPNWKKLAKGKPTCIANEVPTTATVVQVRLDGEPEDTSDVSEVFTAASGELQLPSEAEGVNETEVESELEALKLTQENHSDIDSDFEDFDSEEESDSELVW